MTDTPDTSCKKDDDRAMNVDEPMGRAGTDRFGAAGQPRSPFRKTEADSGLVARPLLTPHLEFRPLGEDTVLLVSESYSAALYGQRYLDLLPLLDGTRTRREIASALAGNHSPVAVQSTLVSMATKGYLVSAEFAMSREMAAFWCSLGVSPRWAEERLRGSRPRVAGDDGRLSAAIDAIWPAGESSTAAPLEVVVVDDYLEDDLAEINRRHLDSGAPWIPVKPRGLSPMFGPVFRPAEGGPCWACLAHRMRGNREVDNFLMHHDAGPVRLRAGIPPLADSIRSLAAVEIAKWVVLGDFARVRDHVISIDPYDSHPTRHQVFRRPQCRVCGDRELYRADRPAQPVQLESSPWPIHNSGGLRSVPPQETLRKYRHVVSPLSGVVTQIERVVEEDESWFHVYWAGNNLALRMDNLRLLRSSLRSKSSGKGATTEQAEASALCEAVERYSGVFHGDEIRRRARFGDFAPGEAMHPNEIQHFSDWQYEHAEEINARGGRFNYIPARFDPTFEMEWTPVWSLTAQRHRYLPTSMLYFAAPLENGIVHCPPDSNGCASGNTLEEAILQGFYELVERDAFACWWYNRLSMPELDLDSFDDPYLSAARDRYRAWRRDMWVLDVTNDLGIPVFVAVSRRVDKEAEDIIFSAGAHTDPRIAALRAVCELNQYFSAVLRVGIDGGDYAYDDPECRWWWKNGRIADHAYLMPAADAPKRRRESYPSAPAADVRDEVERCRALVEGKGMEFLVLDQTRPDIGMPVARTIVPGLRHFWSRFAPGRLYDVPVRMGWRDTPLAEADLNPIPVFI